MNLERTWKIRRINYLKLFKVFFKKFPPFSIVAKIFTFSLKQEKMKCKSAWKLHTYFNSIFQQKSKAVSIVESSKINFFHLFSSPLSLSLTHSFLSTPPTDMRFQTSRIVSERWKKKMNNLTMSEYFFFFPNTGKYFYNILKLLLTPFCDVEGLKELETNSFFCILININLLKESFKIDFFSVLFKINNRPWRCQFQYLFSFSYIFCRRFELQSEACKVIKDENMKVHKYQTISSVKIVFLPSRFFFKFIFIRRITTRAAAYDKKWEHFFYFILKMNTFHTSTFFPI